MYLREPRGDMVQDLARRFLSNTKLIAGAGDSEISQSIKNSLLGEADISLSPQELELFAQLVKDGLRLAEEYSSTTDTELIPYLEKAGQNLEESWVGRGLAVGDKAIHGIEKYGRHLGRGLVEKTDRWDDDYGGRSVD